MSHTHRHVTVSDRNFRILKRLKRIMEKTSMNNVMNVLLERYR